MILVPIPTRYNIQGIDGVTIDACSYDKKNLPCKWAVYSPGRMRLNNTTGYFDYEPMPSSRTDEFIKDHSFDTIDDALKYYVITQSIRVVI